MIHLVYYFLLVVGGWLGFGLVRVGSRLGLVWIGLRLGLVWVGSRLGLGWVKACVGLGMVKTSVNRFYMVHGWVIWWCLGDG